MKLVVEILHEEIKSLKNPSPTDSTADSACSTANSSIPRINSMLRPSKEKHTTGVTPALTEYAVPVENRYAPLSELYDPQAFNDTSEQLPDFPPIGIYRSFKRSRRNNTLLVNQPSLPRIHQPTNPNLLNAKKNEDGSHPIPTIVNGVTSVNLKAKLDYNHSNSFANSIRELSLSIKLYNKDEHVFSKKHKVILIGDSHIKGYGWKLKLLLSNNYEVYSVPKPGSSSSELMNTAKDEISQLSHEDVIVICTGTNDYEVNGFSSTLRNITNFVEANKHTNIILLNVPQRYDLRMSTSVNGTMSTLNRKLKKLVRVSAHTSFLETDSNRNSFTHHGLHLNKSGKRLVPYQLASLLQSTFEQRTSAPIILGWHDVIQDNKISNCAGDQEISLIRNSSRNKRTPITRSDFLWQI